MAGGFYRSVPRNSIGGSANPLLEKKLDEILLAIGDQKNRMILLEEKGTKTLKSVENLESRIVALEDKVTVNFTEQATPRRKTGSKENERSRIPPELSEDVKLLYSKLDAEHQFDPATEYRSPHNAKVSEYLINQVKDKEYTPQQVKKAVHRYYESRRRVLFMDKKPERAEKVLINKKKSKITQGQRRLYDARSKFVKPCEEKYWRQLSFSYMSEEESSTEDESNGKYIIRHSPGWRSADMKLLITKLDKRLLKSSKSSGKNFTRLKREDGESIICVPPLGAPKWAVDSTYWQLDSDVCSSGVSGVGTSDLGSSTVGFSTEVEEDTEDSDFAIES